MTASTSLFLRQPLFDILILYYIPLLHTVFLTEDTDKVGKRLTMRFTALAIAGLCGVALAHDHHQHITEPEVPLHEREFVQDSEEELARKWGFEVCCLLISSSQLVSRGLKLISDAKVGVLRCLYFCASGACKVPYQHREVIRYWGSGRAV